MNVICFGDSNTFGFDPRSCFGDRYDLPWVDILAEETKWKIHNQGVNGQEIPVAPVLFPENMDLLIIMLGTNDLLQGRSLEEISFKMDRFLSGITIPPERILLVAPPPMHYGEWVQNIALIERSYLLAREYRSIAGKRGIRFSDAGAWNVDITFDGVHFTESGHKAFAEGLRKELKQ